MTDPLTDDAGKFLAKDARVPSRALSWCTHGLRAGALLGLSLAVTNQVVLHLAPPALDGSAAPSAVQAAAAVLVSSGLAGLAVALVSVLCLPLLSSPAGRRVAIGCHQAALAIISTFYATSVLLRAMSGAYLTLGAIEFGLNGNTHLFRAAISGFKFEALVIVGLLAALIAVASRQAARALAKAPRVERRAAVRVGAPMAMIGAGLIPMTIVRGLASHSPELALLDSALPPAPTTDEGPPGVVTRSVSVGPPRSDGDRWLRTAEASKGPRPNVILTVLESVPAGHLGHAGYARNVTPNIDRIAARSLRFTRAWSTATHSNYAQMALLSSLFPRRGWGLDVYRRLDYPRFLFHDLLHALGYQVGAISSQDETWQGMLRFQTTNTPLFRWHARDYPGPHLDIGSELAAPDHVTVDEALAWLDRRAPGRPFGLYLNLQATHFPYRIPSREAAPFQPSAPQTGSFNYLRYPESDRDIAINRFDNALSYVDRQLGRLEAHLRRIGVLENTIWILTSDHGELFHEHGLVTHGKTLYDAESRVPLLISWPAELEPGVVDTAVSTLDVLPTVTELLDVPPHPAFQGTSLLAAKEGSRRAVFLNIQGLGTAEAVVCYPWKLVVEHTGHRVRLFDLERDPGERDDRASKDVRVAETLRRVLRDQMRAQHAYHAPRAEQRENHYAPRLSACPKLPGDDAREKARSLARSQRPAPVRAPDPPRPLSTPKADPTPDG